MFEKDDSACGHSVFHRNSGARNKRPLFIWNALLRKYLLRDSEEKEAEEAKNIKYMRVT